MYLASKVAIENLAFSLMIFPATIICFWISQPRLMTLKCKNPRCWTIGFVWKWWHPNSIGYSLHNHHFCPIQWPINGGTLGYTIWNLYGIPFSDPALLVSRFQGQLHLMQLSGFLKQRLHCDISQGVGPWSFWRVFSWGLKGLQRDSPSNICSFNMVQYDLTGFWEEYGSKLLSIQKYPNDV